MSRLAYKGNDLGSGTITLETPNTNTDRTITLPDGSGELIQADSSGNVGIGLTSPSLPLQVKSTGNSPLVNAIGLSPSTNNNVQGGIGVAAGGIVSVSGVNSLRFNTTNTERMRIDSSGRVTMPYQPAFDAHYTSATSGTSGWQKMPVWTGTSFNIGAHYSTSTGRFTAPVDGRYFFYAGGWCSTAGDGTRFAIELRVNGSSRVVGGIQLSDGDSPAPIAGFHVELNANDYTEIWRYHPITISYISGTSAVYSFRHGGYLIG